METSLASTPDLDYSNPNVEANPVHSICITVNSANNYAHIEAKTREALYELGRNLMEQALFGSNEVEFYPMVVDGEALVVNGARLSEKSARLFVRYPRTEGSNG